jgi:cyclase
MHCRVIVLALSLATLASSASGQAPSRYTVEKLAEGVHAVIYNSDLDVEGNTLIVINNDDVFVVDANAGITTARATIAEIRKLTPKPVRYVVNTHWHDDHVYGNQAYAEAYPGVEFIAHPLTRQDIVDHAFASNGFVLDLIAADVKRLEGYLETGRYRDGKPVEGELETRIRTYLANRREALVDRQAFKAVVPTIDIADTMTLKRGAREIQVRFLGRGNTRGDLVVYLPAERIVAAGDLVVYPVPYATNVYAKDWVRTLDALMAVPATTVVPGHGPVMRDWSYVAKVKDAIAQYLAGVTEAKKQGLSLAQTQEHVQLPAIRMSFVGENEPRRAGYEAFFRPTLVRNAWEELDPDIMRAYEHAPVRRFADGVYNLSAPGAAGGLTVLVNDKDVMVVTSLISVQAARAGVRAIRELTSKPVKYLVLTGSEEPQKAALAVLRETYPDAVLSSATATDSRSRVADVLTLRPAGREIRIVREKEALVVELPAERLRITRGGTVERRN